MVKISAVTLGLTLLMLAVSRTSCRYRDLLILLDDSADITSAEWKAIRYDLMSLVLSLCGIMEPGLISTKLSLATFSSTVQHRFNTTEISTSQCPMYMNSIRRMTQTRGNKRCLGRALDYATAFFSSLPPSTQRVREVLILTTGVAYCPGYHRDLVSAINRLQARAFVFALHLGSRHTAVSRNQMESLVSRPLVDHIFSLATFFSFHRMVDTIQDYPAICVPFELS